MTENTPDNRTAVASEEVFSVLANDQRRVALKMLADTDEPIIDLDTLVEQVSGHLHSEDPSMDQYRRTRIALHHNHLPKLDEYGMVVYDPGARSARAALEGVDGQVLSLIESAEASD